MTSPLRDAFREQAEHCEGLGSPFMGRLLRLLADKWPQDTALAKKLDNWSGDIRPMAASLPLRTTGGLHALVLKGMDADLASVYPPNAATDDALWAAVEAVLRKHDDWLCDWVDNAPQTNEVRRSAALIAASNLLNDRFGLPMRLSELGASGGLNLMFDQFSLQLQDQTYGASEATVALSPTWTGALPPVSTPDIRDRRGVDLNPLEAASEEGALRLLAYLWPDQSDRMDRTRAAITLQNAEVDRADAIDWLEDRIEQPFDGLHLIYHTVAWQYFPTDVQARGQQIIEDAGAKATPERPLAWLRMEADGNSPGAGLTMRLWPGDRLIDLGRIDFHGRWVDWQGPERLS
ncbi:DUF2332 family protein [Shimia thalassica]|uniref:DUF2332 domain-containing protein n=1 Tax=Shimia thalassica TaxID=1715693 RepID=UPI0026E17E0E|nr:DUF2332 family protein [Shimia thalassica]MDO6520430.1 DUF2332 family protein [Shimia thalassica]